MNDSSPSPLSEIVRSDVPKVPPTACDLKQDLRRDQLPQSTTDKHLMPATVAPSGDQPGTAVELLSEHDPSAVFGNASDTFVALPTPRIGRRRRLDEKSQLEVCALMSTGMTLVQAASYLGIGRTTIYEAMARDAEFAESVRGAREVSQGQLLLQLAQAGKTSWKAAAFLLEYLEKRAGKARSRKQAKQREEERKAASRASQPLGKDDFDKRGRRIYR